MKKQRDECVESIKTEATGPENLAGGQHEARGRVFHIPAHRAYNIRT